MAAQPSPSPGVRRSTVWIVVAVIVGLVVVAVSVSLATFLRAEDEPTPDAPPSSSSPAGEDPTPDVTDETSVTPEETPAAAGTREDPFAAGDPVTAGGWTTTIGVTDVDGWPALSAGLNDVELAELAPPDGTSYVVAPMTVTYADGAPSDLGSFEVSYVGPSGTSYPVIGSTCRLALDDLFPTSDVYEEPEVTGTVCTDVPTSDAPGGTWRVALNIYDDATSSASKDFEGYVAVD